MSDFLLIHDLGHGAWSWARVWGLLDGDESGKVGRILTVDLPGHGTRRDTPIDKVTFDACVEAVLQDTQAEGLRSPIVVGHGFGALVALGVAAKLQPAPERLVLVAGGVPENGHSFAEGLTLRAQLGLSGIGFFRTRPTLNMGKGAARFLLTNDTTFPVAAGRVLGFLGPFPRALLYHRFTMPQLTPPLPITYVALTNDQFVDARQQERAVTRLPGKVQVVAVDAGHEAPVLAPERIHPHLVEHATPSRRQGLRLVSQYKLGPT